MIELMAPPGRTRREPGPCGCALSPLLPAPSSRPSTSWKTPRIGRRGSHRPPLSSCVRTINSWLFSHDLKQKALDPKRWDDPDYWEDFLEDLDDHMKGGKIAMFVV